MTKRKYNYSAGHNVNMLTVIKPIPNSGNKYLCRCDCGQTAEIYVTDLNPKANRRKSCGCLRPGRKKADTYTSEDFTPSVSDAFVRAVW